MVLITSFYQIDSEQAGEQKCDELDMGTSEVLIVVIKKLCIL